MLNLAIFCSGRLTGYKKCLIPVLNYLKTKYNLFLFLSINSEKDEEAIDILYNKLNINGNYNFKKFFYEKDWLENRIIKNNRKYLGSFNQLSMFYNDLYNFNMIEKYEIENNIKFDIISKIRSDMIFKNISEIKFYKNDPEELLLNDVALACTISYYSLSPPLISDAFCFGNKKSMKIYCNTYNWIKQKDIELKGLYNRTFEPYLNENIFNYIFDSKKLNKNMKI